MAKNNKSAIEWLIENIPQRFANALKNECQDLILEAKKIERDQLFKEFINGIVLSNKGDKKELQKHYDETYGKKKEQRWKDK
jgi:hypothetical protein